MSVGPAPGGVRGVAGVVDPVAALTRTYRAVLLDIVRRIESGAIRPDAYLARQIRPIIEALRGLDVSAAAWAERVVAAVYRAGAAEAQFTLIQGKLVRGPAAFGDFDRRAAQALIARTSTNLAHVRTTLLQGLIGGERPDTARSVRLMREALAGDNALVKIADGTMRVVTPSGRFWLPDKYAKMLGRTAKADARRVAFRARYLQNGIDVVRVVGNGTTHAVCRVWEGERLSLTGITPGLPTVADARAAGLFHPNCRHRYVADPSAEQPGIDLTSPEGPNFSTLGRFQPEGITSQRSAARARLSRLLAR